MRAYVAAATILTIALAMPLQPEGDGRLESVEVSASGAQPLFRREPQEEKEVGPASLISSNSTMKDPADPMQPAQCVCDRVVDENGQLRPVQPGSVTSSCYGWKLALQSRKNQHNVDGGIFKYNSPHWHTMESYTDGQGHNKITDAFFTAQTGIDANRFIEDEIGNRHIRITTHRQGHKQRVFQLPKSAAFNGKSLKEIIGQRHMVKINENIPNDAFHIGMQHGHSGNNGRSHQQCTKLCFNCETSAPHGQSGGCPDNPNQKHTGNTCTRVRIGLITDETCRMHGGKPEASGNEGAEGFGVQMFGMGEKTLSSGRATRGGDETFVAMDLEVECAVPEEGLVEEAVHEEQVIMGELEDIMR